MHQIFNKAVSVIKKKCLSIVFLFRRQCSSIRCVLTGLGIPPRRIQDFLKVYGYIIIGFTALYWLFRDSFLVGGKTMAMGLVESLYFSIGNMTTLSYGDILPNNWIARCLTVLQGVAGTGLIGWFFVVYGQAIAEAEAEKTETRQQALRDKLAKPIYAALAAIFHR